jgi:hypothetical protein
MKSKRKTFLRALFVFVLGALALAYAKRSEESCDYHAKSITFTTGFGRSGNDRESTNWMCHRPVDKSLAERIISHEPYAVRPCPVELQPITWVGPVGARRALCGIRILDPKLPLFSFGSNGNFDFEDAVRVKIPTIDVYIFDPTLDERRAIRRPGELRAALNYAQKRGYHFVQTGIAYRKGELQMEDSKGQRLMGVDVDNLEALMQLTAQERIGILKIDASGEFEIFAQLRKSRFELRRRVGILNLEVHMYHPQPRKGIANCCYGKEDLDDLMHYLASEGFVLVGYEGQVPYGCCAEFSFVNPSFFKSSRVE